MHQAPGLHHEAPGGRVNGRVVEHAGAEERPCRHLPEVAAAWQRSEATCPWLGVGEPRVLDRNGAEGAADVDAQVAD
eukprot:2015796-Lingulodinium_polyedra.AAC.1